MTEILEEGDITLGETTQTYRILRVKVLEGQWEGLEFDIDYGQRQVRPPGILPEIGDEVLITLGQDQNNVLTAYFTDFIRTRPVLILLATFAVFSVVISGWKGIRGLIGMAISLAVIIYYILPNILAGRDPVLISITGAFVLLAGTLYRVYGCTVKTHAAGLGPEPPDLRGLPAGSHRPLEQRCRLPERRRGVVRARGLLDSPDKQLGPIHEDVKQPAGVEVDFIALDVDDNEWWFDVSGAFTSTRPGLQRTDTLWKAIGRAAVVQAAVESGPRYVLLTTDAPRKGTAGAKALQNVVGPNGPIHAVIELLDEVDWQRLRDFAVGVDTLPEAGR